MPAAPRPIRQPSARHMFLPNSGAVVTENGDVLLRLLAKEGSAVTASIGNDQNTALTVELIDSYGNGLYEATVRPALTGPQRVIFRVDGMDVFNPRAPMWYYANTLSNYIELPDPETDELISARRDIPHGSVCHEFIDSEAFGEFVQVLVYAPPGYQAGTRDYPVLYFFHEVAENKTAWTDASRINFLLDNLIADGKCEPFLLVEVDSTVRLDYHELPDWFFNYGEIEQFLSRDCPRFMEKKYRVRPGKWNRAIAGVGLGAVQAGYIGMRNTDVFGSIGLFTAFWPSASFHAEGKPDPFYTAAEYIGSHPAEVDVFYRSEGSLDPHYNGVKDEDALLEQLGITALPGYVQKVYAQTHNWGSYRRSMRDFAPLLFRKK